MIKQPKQFFLIDHKIVKSLAFLSGGTIHDSYLIPLKTNICIFLFTTQKPGHSGVEEKTKKKKCFIKASSLF